MDHKKLLHYLIYSALIELRAEGYEVKNKKIFWVLDLLDNLPLFLSSVQEQEEIEKMFLKIQCKARESNMVFWFEYNLDSYMNSKKNRNTESSIDTNESFLLPEPAPEESFPRLN